MLYPIAIRPGDEQHAWGVDVPDIPGCFSAGEDLDDAMAMAREAIEGHLEILAEDCARIPVATPVSAHVSNPEYEGCIWALVDIDITRYLGKAEKLNITLPAILLMEVLGSVIATVAIHRAGESSKPWLTMETSSSWV